MTPLTSNLSLYKKCRGKRLVVVIGNLQIKWPVTQIQTTCYVAINLVLKFKSRNVFGLTSAVM